MQHSTERSHQRQRYYCITTVGGSVYVIPTVDITDIHVQCCYDHTRTVKTGQLYVADPFTASWGSYAP